jgi:hypothetical protein
MMTTSPKIESAKRVKSARLGVKKNQRVARRRKERRMSLKRSPKSRLAIQMTIRPGRAIAKREKRKKRNLNHRQHLLLPLRVNQTCQLLRKFAILSI